MTAIRVYYSPVQNAVILEGAKEFTPAAGALLASEDPVSADRLQVTYPDLVGQNGQVKRLLGPIHYDQILDENGDPAGANRTDVINYLNNQFMDGGQGSAKPLITSDLSIDVLVGEHFSYTITADNDPVWFDGSSSGSFFVFHNTGLIQGEVQLGLQDIIISAGNSLGVDSKTLTINGISSAGWTNTYSTRFRRTRQQIVNMGAGSDLYFDTSEPFSLSIWRYEGWGGVVNRTAVDLSGYSLSQRATRIIDFEIVGSLGTALSVEGPQVSNNDWTHIIITYDGSETAAGINMYYDGVSQALTINQDNISGSISSTADFILGYTMAQGYQTAHIDEAAVYNKELSAAEVVTIYNLGTPNDLTVNGPVANLSAYWTMGDGDTYPILTDKSVNSNDGQMVNMTINDIVNFTP